MCFLCVVKNNIIVIEIMLMLGDMPCIFFFGSADDSHTVYYTDYYMAFELFSVIKNSLTVDILQVY